MLAISADAEVNLRVMSFNVRYGTANDGPNHWDERKDLVVNTIQEFTPDVIGTQECLDFQADYIVNELPEYRWFGVGREPDCTSEYMAVLYKPKVVAPIETGTFWLSETPEVVGSIAWNSACRRTVTWAKFYYIETKEIFYFLNTHLDHKSEPARQAGAKVLLDYIQKLPRQIPLVLTGDFNAKAGASEAYTVLTEGGLGDAWKTAGEQLGPSVTWSAFKAPEPRADRRIDWILTRGDVDIHRCETVTFNKDGRYPSDHYPVFAAMTLGTRSVASSN